MDSVEKQNPQTDSSESYRLNSMEKTECGGFKKQYWEGCCRMGKKRLAFLLTRNLDHLYALKMVTELVAKQEILEILADLSW